MGESAVSSSLDSGSLDSPWGGQDWLPSFVIWGQGLELFSQSSKSFQPSFYRVLGFTGA